MDFIGIRKLECEPWVSNGLMKQIVNNVYSYFLDTRYRISTDTQRKMAIMHGIVPDISRCPPQGRSAQKMIVPVALLESPLEDEIYYFSRLTLMYQASEPRVLPKKKGKITNLPQEGIKHWTASKMYLVKFSTQLPTYSINLDQLLQYGLLGLDLWLKPLYENFREINTQMIKNPNLCTVALPVITNLKNYSSTVNEWLMFMAWWKLINKQLLPRYCTLRMLCEEAGFGDFASKSEVIHEELILLQSALDDCEKYRGELQINWVTEIDADKVVKVFSAFPDQIVYAPKMDKVAELVLEDHLTFTIHAIRSILDYLLEIKVSAIENKPRVVQDNCFIVIVSGLVRSMAINVKLHTQSENGDVSEADFVSEIIEAAGKMLQYYKIKKVIITAHCQDDLEIRIRTVRRVQNFLHHLAEALISITVKFTAKFLPKSLPHEHLVDTVKHVFLYLTWSAMNNALLKFYDNNPRIASNHIKMLPNEAGIYETLQGIPTDLLKRMQTIVDDCIRESSLYLFRVMPERVMDVEFPLSKVYGDFGNFLRGFPTVFKHGCQPLRDIDYITNGRLIGFMKGMFAAFIKSRECIEDLINYSHKIVNFIEEEEEKEELRVEADQEKKGGGKKKRKIIDLSSLMAKSRN